MSSRRPLIALPSRFAASTSALRYAAEVSARELVAAVYAAGGEPLQVHPDGSLGDDEVAERLAFADGILLPGGGDLSGRWSGQGHHPSLYDVDEEQDAFDLAVARVALERGIPTLAVCRGLQVVNVVRGGTLIQDMDSHDTEIGHHRHRVHHVTVDQGTVLCDVVGESVEVSCYHHQALDVIGEELVVTARSEEGVVEGVEMPSAPGWFLGVQWHPEDNWRTVPQQRAVFEALVTAAAASVAAR
ncbi:gamma-glutamyl-gamma-aminobutyrate hydrolase family protein [Nocardioides caldifontis]|uniref:gamma-glutamyl-gamma-aminobutyrate hydrolase family protein n=1 Tax=Nocardioides caldifontis TaxID=2588938 RepID=UPI0011DFEF1B|nr:gamma-glutamyl-gamma-aminobutyrate hydrolase family protein [Nocardioides caldifontis]